MGFTVAAQSGSCRSSYDPDEAPASCWVCFTLCIQVLTPTLPGWDDLQCHFPVFPGLLSAFPSHPSFSWRSFPCLLDMQHWWPWPRKLACSQLVVKAIFPSHRPPGWTLWSTYQLSVDHRSRSTGLRGSLSKVKEFYFTQRHNWLWNNMDCHNCKNEYLVIRVVYLPGFHCQYRCNML